MMATVNMVCVKDLAGVRTTPPPKAKAFCHQNSTGLPVMSTVLDAHQYCGKF